MKVDEKILFENMSPDGLIQLKLKKGQYEIKAYYDGPPGWRYIALLPLLGCALLALFLQFQISLPVRYLTSKTIKAPEI